eukprot:SM000058S18491  [mRNA]  locus=s58:163212:163728:- [translate_table: standard]
MAHGGGGEGAQDLPEHGVTVVFAALGSATIELLQPLGAASPVAKFLDRNPRGGVHHVCLNVDSIRGAATHLRDCGVRILGDGNPKLGAHHNPVLFLNPGDTHGVLIELEQCGMSGLDSS